MEKIILANKKEYELVVNGIQENQHLTLKINGTGLLFKSVKDDFKDENATKKITLLFSNGSESAFSDYIVFKSIMLEENVVIGQEDVKGVMTDIVSNVITIILLKKDMQAQLTERVATLEVALAEMIGV